MIYPKKSIKLVNAIYKEQKRNFIWFETKIKRFFKKFLFEISVNRDIFFETESRSNSSENLKNYASDLNLNKNKQNNKTLDIYLKKSFVSDYKNHSKVIPSFSDKEYNDKFISNQISNETQKIYTSNSKQNNKKNSIENRANSQNSRFMDVLSSPKQPSVSITYEEIGLFPRSFNRVFDRFFKQLFFDVENLVIQEYRFYRYLFLTTVKCVFILIFVPFLVNFICKNYLVKPITEYYWNSAQSEIFLNSYQQKRAFMELKDFEEKIYFESLIDKAYNSTSPFFSLKTSDLDFQKNPNQTQFNHSRDQRTFVSDNEESDEKIQKLKKSKKAIYPSHVQSMMSFEKNIEPIVYLNSGSNANQTNIELNTRDTTLDQSIYELNESGALPHFIDVASFNRKEYKLDEYVQKRIQAQIQQKTLELAIHYNEESIESITNFFADLISFSTLCFLLKALEIQINITKSFLLEVFFGLDDSKKSLLILFVTDLLVGYHSPNIWELFFQSLFDHYGLPESQTTIFLLVATLPVLLDVLFKYLIFRHLNRASPATVATYHAMIE
uniref:Potassium/proton antiporter CemA n=1 Tax=Bracteacoccus minor TaxID=50037 RepID=A0A140HAM7_9CHLO|nr:chloroplast envelope membrane protein [Bracteacoccus minor]AMO01226.1 chloroplast envelope membrane protein [Bracteacoccus minor]